MEKTLESPVDSKEIKSVNPRKSTLNIHWKDWCWSWSSNTLSTWGKEPIEWKRLWCWERLRARGEGVTEDEMARWHHWLHGRESEWSPGIGDGQGGLACCDSWGRRESDTTEWLNWTDCFPNTYFLLQTPVLLHSHFQKSLFIFPLNVLGLKIRNLHSGCFYSFCFTLSSLWIIYICVSPYRL